MVTTKLVVIETVSLLTKRLSPFHARQWYQRLEQSPGVEIRDYEAAVFLEAEKLWQSRRDKEWDLIDCYSFSIMRREGIGTALAFDEHFRQGRIRDRRIGAKPPIQHPSDTSVMRTQVFGVRR